MTWHILLFKKFGTFLNHFRSHSCLRSFRKLPSTGQKLTFFEQVLDIAFDSFQDRSFAKDEEDFEKDIDRLKMRNFPIVHRIMDTRAQFAVGSLTH